MNGYTCRPPAASDSAVSRLSVVYMNRQSLSAAATPVRNPVQFYLIVQNVHLFDLLPPTPPPKKKKKKFLNFALDYTGQGILIQTISPKAATQQHFNQVPLHSRVLCSVLLRICSSREDNPIACSLNLIRESLKSHRYRLLLSTLFSTL